MLNPHALLHGHLVKFLIVVGFGHTLWPCLALVIQERRVIVWDALLIFDIAERVEKFLVVGLGVLKLFRQVVLHVAISATLARLVRLVALGAHRHNICDALLNYSAFCVGHAQDKLEQISQLFLLVR